VRWFDRNQDLALVSNLDFSYFTTYDFYEIFMGLDIESSADADPVTAGWLAQARKSLPADTPAYLIVSGSATADEVQELDAFHAYVAENSSNIVQAYQWQQAQNAALALQLKLYPPGQAEYRHQLLADQGQRLSQRLQPMRRHLAAILAVLVCLTAGALAQGPDDLNAGSQLAYSGSTGAYTFSWWGVAGNTYLIETSDDMVNWSYLPVVRDWLRRHYPMGVYLLIEQPVHAVGIHHRSGEPACGRGIQWPEDTSTACREIGSYSISAPWGSIRI